MTGVETYARARRLGLKEYHARMQRGENPCLPALAEQVLDTLKTTLQSDKNDGDSLRSAYSTLGDIAKANPELAEQVFDMPVRIGYPSNVGGLLEQINTPRTTTAVGLVLFGSHSRSFAAQEQGGVFSRFKRWLKGVV